jgi:hypothetical protein
MARLPESIAIEVIVPDGMDRDGLLVGLTFRVGPRDYYGTFIGVTDSAGRVAIQHETLAEEFAEDHRAFPMDYKLSLAECDGAVVDLADARDFMIRRTAALSSGLLGDRGRTLWLAAKNPGLWAAPAIIPVDGSAVAVTLVARRSGLP